MNSTATKLALQSLYGLASIVIPLLVYAAVLSLDIPKSISFAARYELSNVLLASALLLYLAYRLSGWIGTLASSSFTLILFALPLSALWNSGVSDSNIIAGLLPWSDASSYYWDARLLLEGGIFTPVSTRRPLFPGMLSALLGLTQQNLQLTLAILVAITALSCFFLAREIQRTHGTTAGLLTLILLFLFYRHYIGKPMTENLGLSLGALGLALLWRGAWQRQLNNCLLGLFVLTLALNARAGAFFILPAIILWGAWSFRGTTRFSWRFILVGFSAVLLGFILNSILIKFIGSPAGMGFSNFSYSLYGLVKGGNWTQVKIDYPEIALLKEPERSERIYALAFEALRANPRALVNGAFRAWKQFLFDNYVFSFIGNLKANLVLQSLTLITLFVCYYRRREIHASLIVIATLGILTSVPFVPPWDTEKMRAYGAIIPVIVLLPALGLAFILRKIKLQQLIKTKYPDSSSNFLRGFSIILAVFVFVSPITIRLLSRVPQLANVSCLDATDAVYLRISLGSSVNLIPDDSLEQTRLPNVRLSDFRSALPSLGYPEIVKELSTVSSSTTMIHSFNLKNGKLIWLIADTAKMPQYSGIVGVCGKFTTNQAIRDYGFFYANSVVPISIVGSK